VNARQIAPAYSELLEQLSQLIASTIAADHNAAD